MRDIKVIAEQLAKARLAVEASNQRNIFGLKPEELADVIATTMQLTSNLRALEAEANEWITENAKRMFEEKTNRFLREKTTQ